MRDYRGLKGEDKPFARDGMSVDEICALWRESRKNREQIIIIGQLCGASPAEVRDFLTDRGYIVEASGERERQRWNNKTLQERFGGTGYKELVNRVKELAIEMSADDVALSLNLSRYSVYQIAEKHKIEFYNAKYRIADERRAMAAYCKVLGEEQGMDANEIAAKVGRSADYIRKLSKAFGFSYKKGKKGRWSLR